MKKVIVIAAALMMGSCSIEKIEEVYVEQTYLYDHYCFDEHFGWIPLEIVCLTPSEMTEMTDEDISDGIGFKFYPVLDRDGIIVKCDGEY